MIYAVLILIALATRTVGDLRPTQYIILEAIVFGWLWLRQEDWFSGPAVLNRLLIWVSAVLAAGLYLRADIYLKFAILFGLALLLRRSENPQRRATAETLLIGLGIYSVVWTVLLGWPLSFNFLRKFSFWYSDLFAALAPPQLLLGPTAAGWVIILAGLAFLLALQLRSDRASWGNTLSGALLLLIGQLVFWAVGYSLTVKISSWISVTEAGFIHLSVFYLFWTLAVVRVIHWIHPPSPLKGNPFGFGRRVVWAGLGILGLLALVFAWPTGGSDGVGKRVLILNADRLDSLIPNFQRFGDRSGGMFGMLPRFCRALGYETRLANVTPEIFDSVDVIVFANMVDSLPPWQRDSVISFVRQGGGVLALADHTGYTAIRGPTNEITEPMGLSLNFDTAVPLRRSWVGQLRYLPHRISQSARRHAEVEVWLGASVDPALGSMPVVVGTQAYSDPGDINNPDRSYLGNLSYDAGEPLGDVVLVGASCFGKGRAALFGDTSPFQNGALVKSHRLAARTLAWLAGGGNAGWEYFRNWAFPIILLITLVTVVMLLGLRIFGWMLLVLLPVITISLPNLFPAGEPEAWHSDELRLAYIDATHGQMYDLMGWERYSIGGLEFNLMRNGFAPQLRHEWRAGLLTKARLVVLTRPTQPITAGEIDQLETYIENGGWVLVTAGWEEHKAVDELFDRFGLKVENIPLGAAEGQGLGEKVSFARAYALSTADPRTEVLCTASRLPVVAAVRRGEGGIIAIADPVFLFNENLENRGDDYKIENIRYFHELMAATVGSWGRIEELDR